IEPQRPAKLAQLALDREPGLSVFSLGHQQLQSRLERYVFSDHSQKTAALQLAFRPQAGNRGVSGVQSRAKAVAHRRLPHLLDSPETSHQKECKGNEREQKCTCGETHLISVRPGSPGGSTSRWRSAFGFHTPYRIPRGCLVWNWRINQ